MGEDFEKWSQIIRACLLTSKTPLTPFEINRDINTLEGRDVPYKAFNCRNMEEMLRKVPGLRIFQVQGKTVAQTIPTEQTAHIARLVKLQKPSKKRPRTIQSGFNKISMNNRRPPFNVNRNNIPQANQYNFNNRFTPNNRPNASVSSRINIAQQQNHEQFRKTTPPPSLLHTRFTPPTSTPPPLLPTPSPTPISKKNVQTAKPSSIQQRLEVKTPPVQPSQPAPAPKPAAPSIQVEDPRLRLNSYAEAMKLPMPIYKDLPTKNNNVYSSVTVIKKYSSYPKLAKTKEEAEKIAAQAALDDLLGQSNEPEVITNDKNLVTMRILAIVNEHPNGVFEYKVGESYTTKYKERLPKNWLALVERSITIEAGANNLIILSPRKDPVQRNRPSSPTLSSEPESLNLHNWDEFWLHVYTVYNTTDIWGIIIDDNHSTKVEELARQMNIYYTNNSVKATNIEVGKHYVIYDTEWHRVRCIKTDFNNQTATVFFIDRGDEDEFDVSRIYVLDKKFSSLPGQAVRLSLAGLEVFQSCTDTQSLLEDFLADKDVYVKRVGYTEESLSAEVYLSVNDDEINANEFLSNEIVKKILDPTIYMSPDKAAQEVSITYVSENTIFVQLKSKSLDYLQSLMSDLIKDLNNTSKLRPVLKIDPMKIYLTKNPEDNKWYRVKVTKIVDANDAIVTFIDVGNSMTVTKNNLILLEDLSKLLTIYPNQALQVQLHKISPLMFDKKMVNHLRSLAPKSKIFYMKVVDNLEALPIVEFYKRTEDNYLASLNDTLALEPELTSKDDNNNAKSRVRNNRSSTGTCSTFPVKAPTISPVGSYFDVYVTMAAHPNNFTVQPLETSTELEAMMKELSRVCDSYTGPPLTSSSVKVGNMYAVKYDDDGKWYRACVSKVISSNVCAVYFCDYGDYRAVSLDYLQPLQNQFYDLPYQAIKAKLYGVTPKCKGDWTVNDSIRFNELVVCKKFVSIIKSCDMDNITSTEKILSLELVDVSTSEDIYISNILVNENRADKIEEQKV